MDTSTPDIIALACRCGQRFRAQPSLAGRLIKCPACTDPLRIPATIRQAAQGAAELRIPDGLLPEEPIGETSPAAAAGRARWMNRLSDWGEHYRQELQKAAFCVLVPPALALLSMWQPELAIRLSEIVVLGIYFALIFVSVWLVAIAFGEGISSGLLFVFVPLVYPAIFIVKHWGKCRSPCLAGLASFVMMAGMTMVLRILGHV